MKPPPRDPTHQGLSNHLPKPCHDLPKNICFFLFCKILVDKIVQWLFCIVSRNITKPTISLHTHYLLINQALFQWYQECGGCCHGLGDLIYSTWQNKPPSLINKHIYMHNTFVAFVGWILLTSLYVQRVLLLVDS